MLLKWILVALIAWAAVQAQVAEKANERYRTKEGRDSIARRLGDPHRDKRQKPEDLVAALGIDPGMTVADLGAGVGYLMPHLAKAVGPSGTVIVQDIFEDFLDRAREKAKSEGISNVTFVLGTETDPRLPKQSVDLVIALDVYHHFNYPAPMLAGIRKALRPGRRFVVVDFYKRGFRDPEHIRLDEPEALREIAEHGLRLISSRPFIPDTQYMAVFEVR